jgi:hypothetical protein
VVEDTAPLFQRSIPGFDDVGISLVHRDGTIETKAATGDLVWELDSIQYHLGDGPCVSSLREEPVIVVDHLRHAERWPQYVPQAAQRGLKAQMALRLYVDENGTIGGLNLYSTSSEDIEPHAPQLAEVFAAQADRRRARRADRALPDRRERGFQLPHPRLEPQQHETARRRRRCRCRRALQQQAGRPYLGRYTDVNRVTAQLLGDHRATTVLRALLAHPVAETT